MWVRGVGKGGGYREVLYETDSKGWGLEEQTE